MSNEIIVDFATGEVAENKHMEYIDYIFDTMNKADAKKAMKNLVSMMLEVREEDRELMIDSLLLYYDKVMEEDVM
jgi:hypothetical protein